MPAAKTETAKPDWDVIVIGAGISGVNAAHHLHKAGLSYRVLESRNSIGGTWDLFRYPGIRSDSDLYSFGFPWYPWKQSNPIANAASILSYVKEAGVSFGLEKDLQLNTEVSTAEWSSSSRTWKVTVRKDSAIKTYVTRFIIFGTGYYDYHTPLEVDIPNLDAFKGRVIHPQFWPEDYDYTGDRIIVIGSGATAITLVPALANKAKQVTMLQRSPSYIAAISNTSWASKVLPYGLTRMWWIWTARLFYLFCRQFPKKSRSMLQGGVNQALRGSVPLDPHFVPRYEPWDQRLCMSPDGDFFDAFANGKANVATGVIQNVLEDGILLKSGERVDGDTIITATGLKLQLAGGIEILVDGTPVEVPSKTMWRGFMLEDLPNASFVLGYTNASWTLGAEASCAYTIRIISHMRKKGFASITPRRPATVRTQPLMKLDSTYVQASRSSIPVTGNSEPWLNRESYWYDSLLSKYGTLNADLEKVRGVAF